MLYLALIRWTVAIVLAPLRLVGGADLHEAAYRKTMGVIGAISLVTFVLIVIAAITGAGSPDITA